MYELPPTSELCLELTDHKAHDHRRVREQETPCCGSSLLAKS